jgi:hypothetical protein
VDEPSSSGVTGGGFNKKIMQKYDLRHQGTVSWGWSQYICDHLGLPFKERSFTEKTSLIAAEATSKGTQQTCCSLIPSPASHSLVLPPDDPLKDGHRDRVGGGDLGKVWAQSCSIS